MKQQIQNELEEHIESWSIMREVELVEDAEANLTHAIEAWHNRGLNYWQILRVLLVFISILVMKADAEYWQKQNLACH